MIRFRLWVVNPLSGRGDRCRGLVVLFLLITVGLIVASSSLVIVASVSSSSMVVASSSKSTSGVRSISSVHSPGMSSCMIAAALSGVTSPVSAARIERAYSPLMRAMNRAYVIVHCYLFLHLFTCLSASNSLRLVGSLAFVFPSFLHILIRFCFT